MRLMKSEVQFIVMHSEALFAPTFAEYAKHHLCYPVISRAWSEVAKRLNIQAGSYEVHDEAFEGENCVYFQKSAKFLGMLTPVIHCDSVENQANEGKIYKYDWGTLHNHTYVRPAFRDENLPEYLKQFEIEGSKIRQGIESPCGCTWYALTEDHKLWEIDKE